MDKLITHSVEVNEQFNPVKEFPDLFPNETPTKLPPLRKINHKINLIPGATWKPVRYYSHDRFRDQVSEKINRETKTGRMYPAPNTSNVVNSFSKPKKDGRIRFLLDCVPRNKVTIKDKTPLPNMDQLIEWIANKKFWSKLDLVDGYHNIRMDPDSEQYTTFLTHRGQYNSRVMQQGDCNAPATMMKVMQDIFSEEVYRNLVIYLDDIIIATDSYEEHVRMVRLVLNKLRDEGFYLNTEKCQFLTKRLEVLGHIITHEGLSADPAKISKVMEFKIPHNKKLLQAFIGIVNYLGKFCPKLASVAAPLTDLQGSTTVWRWTDMHTKSFEECKALINSNEVINPINYESTDPIYLITDASDIGVGAWLGQGPNIESLRPARFYSKKLNPAQLNYSTKNKELLAIIAAVKFFEPQIRGVKFTILTDHKPLVTFMEKAQAEQKTRRWQAMLSEHDCTIQHIEGVTNILVDYLSRKHKY